MTCACGQPLLAPTSIESGICGHCALYGPAPEGSRTPAAAKDVVERADGDLLDEDDDEMDGAQFRRRRSSAAPLPPGPPCVHCGNATHARTQRDRDGRPAHLQCAGPSPEGTNPPEGITMSTPDREATA